MKRILWSILFVFLLPICFYTSLRAQKLMPGFDIEEYLELLKISAKIYDREATSNLPSPEKFTMSYRSPAIGLENGWELWESRDSIAVICIRPTIENETSLLVNMYMAMVPAAGKVKLTDNNIFHYRLAMHPEAAVHIGYFLSMAYLWQDIQPRIDSCYHEGVRNIYITGHSQGGAISYLLTSHIYYLQKSGTIPRDIHFKTYCSAAPKPGNLYFANEYEYIRKEGWAYNVINADDWVPETPFTIQTIDDFVEANPFCNAKTIIKQQKFPKNIFLRTVYNRVDRPSRKTLKNYQKYMGDKISCRVTQRLEGLEIPQYYRSCHYVRAGQTIVLFGNEEYYRHFPVQKEKILTHHRPDAYFYLAERYY